MIVLYLKFPVHNRKLTQLAINYCCVFFAVEKSQLPMHLEAFTIRHIAQQVEKMRAIEDNLHHTTRLCPQRYSRI